MNAQIGQVVRNGNTVYYAFIGGRELSNLVESSNAQDIEDLLNGKAPEAKAVAPKKAKKEQKAYIVHVEKKYPAWNEVGGADVEVMAENAKDAIGQVKRQDERDGMYMRTEGPVRYTAKKA